MLRRACFHRFLDCSRHFTCFTVTKTNSTITITHYGQRGESEDTTTFNGLGNAVHLNQLFLQAVAGMVLMYVSPFARYLP